jgi:L-threonylcarbamoyladenylate synthase
MIDETVAALNQKKLILYPTDTVWGIGGDATDYEVVEKIYRLKQRAGS